MIFGDPDFGNRPLEKDLAIHAVNFFDLLPSKAISPNDKAALIASMPLGFLVSWVLSNFTDREIVPCFGDQLPDRGLLSDGQRNQDGLYEFTGGTLAPAISELEGERRQAIYSSLSKLVLGFTQLDNQRHMGLPRGILSTIQYPQAFVGYSFGEYGIHVGPDKPIQVVGRESLRKVVNFGPGLSGSNFAVHLMGSQGEVDNVSGGPSGEFIRTWLNLCYESSRAGFEQFAHQGVDLKTIDPKMDGVIPELPVMNQFIGGIRQYWSRYNLNPKRRPSNPTTVMLSSVHTAGVEECSEGVLGAAKNLTEGGYLLVMAPDWTEEGFAGFTAIGGLANNMFGRPIVEDERPTTNLITTPSGRSLHVPGRYALYQKQ